MAQNEIRSFRIDRAVKLAAKAEDSLKKIGVNIAPVPQKLLLPIISEASLEDDGHLRNIWANLLANAADERGESEVLPCFPTMLREFTSRDARFLDAMYSVAQSAAEKEHVRNRVIEGVRIREHQLHMIYAEAGLASTEVLKQQQLTVADYERHGVRADLRKMYLGMDLFQRLRIIEKQFESPIREGNTNTMALGSWYAFTALGTSFVRACRPPER